MAQLDLDPAGIVYNWILDVDPDPKFEFMYPLIRMDPEHWFEHILHQKLF
jgi:hypothetical protein